MSGTAKPKLYIFDLESSLTDGALSEVVVAVGGEQALATKSGIEAFKKELTSGALGFMRYVCNQGHKIGFISSVHFEVDTVLRHALSLVLSEDQVAETLERAYNSTDSGKFGALEMLLSEASSDDFSTVVIVDPDLVQHTQAYNDFGHATAKYAGDYKIAVENFSFYQETMEAHPELGSSVSPWLALLTQESASKETESHIAIAQQKDPDTRFLFLSAHPKQILLEVDLRGFAMVSYLGGTSKQPAVISQTLAYLNAESKQKAGLVVLKTDQDIANVLVNPRFCPLVPAMINKDMALQQVMQAWKESTKPFKSLGWADTADALGAFAGSAHMRNVTLKKGTSVFNNPMFQGMMNADGNGSKDYDSEDDYEDEFASEAGSRPATMVEDEAHAGDLNQDYEAMDPIPVHQLYRKDGGYETVGEGSSSDDYINFDSATGMLKAGPHYMEISEEEAQQKLNIIAALIANVDWSKRSGWFNSTEVNGRKMPPEIGELQTILNKDGMTAPSRFRQMDAAVEKMENSPFKSLMNFLMKVPVINWFISKRNEATQDVLSLLSDMKGISLEALSAQAARLTAKFSESHSNITRGEPSIHVYPVGAQQSIRVHGDPEHIKDSNDPNVRNMIAPVVTSEEVQQERERVAEAYAANKGHAGGNEAAVDLQCETSFADRRAMAKGVVDRKSFHPPKGGVDMADMISIDAMAAEANKPHHLKPSGFALPAFNCHVESARTSRIMASHRASFVDTSSVAGMVVAC